MKSQELVYSLAWNKQETDRMYKIRFQDPRHQAMKNNSLWQLGREHGEPYNDPSFTLWESFQGGKWRGNPGGTQRASCVKEMYLRAEGQQGSESSRDRELERGQLHAEETLEVCRGLAPLEYLAEYSSVHVRKNQQKAIWKISKYLETK